MDIKLGLNIYIEEAGEVLMENLSDRIDLSRKEYDKMTLFTMMTDKMEKEEFDNHVADIILKIILENHVLDNIRKKLDTYREYLGEDERELAYDMAREMIADEYNYILEKEYIKEEIINYIGEYPIIYLDGFVIFRLKNLKELTETIIEQTVESLDLEREQDNFMDVLKYLADSGDIGYDVVRIVFEEEGYRLLDEDGDDIDRDYFEKIARTIEGVSVSEEDLLISTLLALSPEKVLVHMGDYNERKTLDLIERIFENKVYYCYNCKNCIRKVGLKTR